VGDEDGSFVGSLVGMLLGFEVVVRAGLFNGDKNCVVVCFLTTEFPCVFKSP